MTAEDTLRETHPLRWPATKVRVSCWHCRREFRAGDLYYLVATVSSCYATHKACLTLRGAGL